MRRDRDQENIKKYQEIINEREAEILARHRLLALEEIRKMYEAMDAELSQELLGTGRYRDMGYIRRKVQTGIGAMRPRTRRLRRKERPGSVYPIYTVGKVGRVSGVARERCIQAAIGQSYAQSHKTLKILSGMAMSRMGIWKVIQESGEAERKEHERQRSAMFEQGVLPTSCRPHQDKVVVEVDGVLIGARREVVESQTVAGVRRMEVKVGVAFRGVRQQSAQRRCTIARSIHGKISSAEEFAESWYVHCLQHGIDEQTSVHVLGDGAPWIRTVRAESFPGSRYTLDLCHLRRNARSVLTDRQYNEFSHRIWSGSGDEMISYVRRLRPSDATHQEELHSFQEYLEANREGLVYRRGKLNGSGVIEKTIDILVARRMKRRGMSWSKDGANNIIALKALALNRESTLRDSLVAYHTF
jgi:hypothetical protein